MLQVPLINGAWAFEKVEPKRLRPAVPEWFPAAKQYGKSFHITFEVFSAFGKDMGV
jgi:hypothetical protein